MARRPHAARNSAQNRSNASTSARLPGCFASVFPGKDYPLDEATAGWFRSIEVAFKRKALLLVQNGQPPFGYLDNGVHRAVISVMDELEKDQPIVVVLHSPGGYADAAFRIARLLRDHCGEFSVLVPLMAKSAATLLALGADEIYMGAHAELGPLDAQVDDVEREQRISALEVVQSVERLNSEAMQAVDAIMRQWIRNSGKRTDTLLPIATEFVAQMLRPLFDKIDTLKYTQMARVLKIGQDYACRLLERKYGMLVRDDGTTLAEDIAAALTKSYSDHGFVLTPEELNGLGLKINTPPKEIAEMLTPLGLSLSNRTIIGLLKEFPQDAQTPRAASLSDSNPGRANRGSNRTRDSGVQESPGVAVDGTTRE